MTRSDFALHLEALNTCPLLTPSVLDAAIPRGQRSPVTSTQVTLVCQDLGLSDTVTGELLSFVRRLTTRSAARYRACG